MLVVSADLAAIERAAAALRRGGLVAFPTETVYGLGADATDPAALAGIFTCKGRPADHPLIVHLAAASDLARWVGDLPSAALALARAFWPGPLTLVLPWSPGAATVEGRAISAVATGQRRSIGVRVPDHPVALALLRAVDRPVAAPSANRFGRVSPTLAAHVAAEFQASAGSVRSVGATIDGVAAAAPELILDGGPCRVGVESTIVELVSEPTLLRAGGVPAEAIEAVLGVALRAATGPSRASGMLASHYAPRASVVLIDHARLTDLTDVVAAERAAGHRVALIGIGPWPAGLDHDILIPGPIADTNEYARLLYACLREADHRGVDTVIALSPPEDGLGRAVADRLRKAAAPRP